MIMVTSYPEPSRRSVRQQWMRLPCDAPWAMMSVRRGGGGWYDRWKITRLERGTRLDGHRGVESAARCSTVGGGTGIHRPLSGHGHLPGAWPPQRLALPPGRRVLVDL